MTKAQAFAEATRRWFTQGTSPMDVVAYASRGRNSPIYRVGARRRGTRADPGEIVQGGFSDVSWEDAFADAERKSLAKIQAEKEEIEDEPR